MSEKDSGLDLSEAEAALERGDYGQCLDLLLPLAETHPPNSPEGPRLRYLMITAWMGQGQDDKAISTSVAAEIPSCASKRNNYSRFSRPPAWIVRNAGR